MQDCDASDGQFKYECLLSGYKRDLNISNIVILKTLWNMTNHKSVNYLFVMMRKKFISTKL